MSKLLKVLDMNAKEQRAWLLINVFHERMPRESNADLAFRLRDEVCGEVVHFAERFKHEMAMRTVYEHSKDKGEFLLWLLADAKPIHWIIAALIAKEMSSKKK